MPFALDSKYRVSKLVTPCLIILEKSSPETFAKPLMMIGMSNYVVRDIYLDSSEFKVRICFFGENIS